MLQEFSKKLHNAYIDLLKLLRENFQKYGDCSEKYTIMVMWEEALVFETEKCGVRSVLDIDFLVQSTIHLRLPARSHNSEPETHNESISQKLDDHAHL